MRAVISVVGSDKPGILAFVASECAANNANIVDVTQTVLQSMFTMIMIVEYDNDSKSFGAFADDLEEKGVNRGLKIHVMHEDIFTAMHTI